ncbi:hypothetical protein FDK21_04930 [Cohaesibacter sp. CAU 1516]|uniref:hypothetical protein n=1 Tax=Cohaesibacter sp. CAU 1516 TaxID=2576038 RepID=UPI0010FD8C59|nr:hypothetical protein [Cohaesibacter sp. CAU 1516]TLP48991.1 hypothetical protein FDK21_04930 [Cohaesibacter sp. CAU 1516]
MSAGVEIREGANLADLFNGPLQTNWIFGGNQRIVREKPTKSRGKTATFNFACSFFTQQISISCLQRLKWLISANFMLDFSPVSPDCRNSRLVFSQGVVIHKG